jgi:phosphatidylglycerophosphate synthase
MLGNVKAIYLATRKKHDQLFNRYFMRPLAAGVVAVLAPTPITPNQITLLNLAIFVAAAGLFAALPSYGGGLVGVAVLELSYLFDCTDGMLARHKKIASKEGHLFDFFTDESKAVLLAGSLAIRLYRGGGLGLDLTRWPAGTPWFLYAGIAGTVIMASAISLTNFVRRPELSGKETTVEAFYETAEAGPKRSLVGQVASLVFMFLRFLNHYPSHIWIFAAAGRLDVFFWIYVAINLLYLARGWLGLVVRFGRFPKAQG